MFKEIQQIAENNREGIWWRSSLIGSKVARTSGISKGEAVEVDYPININTADYATLKLLPGIGDAYAKRIIKFREKHGGFDQVEHRGIGEVKFLRLRPVVTQ